MSVDKNFNDGAMGNLSGDVNNVDYQRGRAYREQVEAAGGRVELRSIAPGLILLVLIVIPTFALLALTDRYQIGVEILGVLASGVAAFVLTLRRQRKAAATLVVVALGIGVVGFVHGARVAGQTATQDADIRAYDQLAALYDADVARFNGGMPGPVTVASARFVPYLDSMAAYVRGASVSTPEFSLICKDVYWGELSMAARDHDKGGQIAVTMLPAAQDAGTAADHSPEAILPVSIYDKLHAVYLRKEPAKVRHPDVVNKCLAFHGLKPLT